LGYNSNIQKLSTLSAFEIAVLINGLNVFPGHKEKLLSVFSVIKQMYHEESKVQPNPPLHNNKGAIETRPILGIGYFLGQNISNEIEEFIMKYQGPFKNESHKVTNKIIYNPKQSQTALCQCFAHALIKHVKYSNEKTVEDNTIKVEKLKEMLSETFTWSTKQEMLDSFLTVEDPEEDIDFSYTQTHLEGFLNDCKKFI